ncbi:MAG TPA: hypothetical protein VGO92_09135 [Acidimicrobiales bacterium]|jgi:hypothetical protein|nr:hypothetical protein [Acidimicrobiales bacterium]
MSPRLTRTRRRLLYGLALAVAAVAFVAAFLTAPDPAPPDRPPAVVAVSPSENTKEVRQTTVFAELAADFDGTLLLDGKPIPDDQVDQIQTGGNRVSFTPGPNKEFTSFTPGRHCAVVRYWPVSEGEGSATTYSWCYELH